MADLPERPRVEPGNGDLAPPLQAERERAIVRLSESFARDELSLDEYEHRVSLVYAAPTLSALQAVAADLPAAPERPDPDLAAVPLAVTAVLSNVVRSAAPAAPKWLRLRSWAGNIEIDLSRSRLMPGVTEIELDVIVGNVEITLPAHAHLDDQSSVFLGSFDSPRPAVSLAPLPSGEPPTVVRFSGRVVLGSVSIRTR